MADVLKPELFLQRNGRVHLIGVGSNSVIYCSRGVRNSGERLYYLWQVRWSQLENFAKRRQGAGKSIGEREIIYNVYKFMRAVSNVGITIPLWRQQKRVAEETSASRRNLCRLLKDCENYSYLDLNARRVTVTYWEKHQLARVILDTFGPPKVPRNIPVEPRLKLKVTS